MKNKKIKNDTVLLIILFLFIVIGSLFIYNKHDIFITSESDDYFHALGAFFVYDFARWWITSPTFSPHLIMSFAIDYQIHYKFFGGISYYQPLQSLFVGFLAFFSGKYPLTFYISTTLETLGTMLYAYKIYALIYGEKKKLFLFLVPLFIAFNPVAFHFGASYSLDVGVMLFSTMTIFYFIRYIKKENKKDLYMTAISFGLGMLLKTPFIIVFPILLISVFIERKQKLMFKNYKALIISFVIFFIILSPWLISEYTFSSLGISRIGERIELAIFKFPSTNKLLENLSGTIWVIFGTFLLVPFFFYKFLKSKLLTGEITMLIFIIFYSTFYNFAGIAINFLVHRYLMSSIPFVTILSIRGIQLFYEQKNKFKSYIIPIVSFILFTSILSCYNYTTQQKIEYASTDFLSPAIYISDHTEAPTTVMSTFSRAQAVAFSVLNTSTKPSNFFGFISLTMNKNISVVEAPYKFSGGEEEANIMLDSKDYVKRPHKPEWERFNLTHPPIGWVVVHEKYDGVEPDYKLKEIIDKRSDFSLVYTIEGSWPGNRVFIYKRNESLFG